MLRKSTVDSKKKSPFEKQPYFFIKFKCVAIYATDNNFSMNYSSGSTSCFPIGGFVGFAVGFDGFPMG